MTLTILKCPSRLPVTWHINASHLIHPERLITCTYLLLISPTNNHSRHLTRANQVFSDHGHATRTGACAVSRPPHRPNIQGQGPPAARIGATPFPEAIPSRCLIACQPPPRPRSDGALSLPRGRANREPFPADGCSPWPFLLAALVLRRHRRHILSRESWGAVTPWLTWPPPGLFTQILSACAPPGRSSRKEICPPWIGFG